MKFQLHQSGMSMLSRCGEQFRRRYIEGEKLPPRASLARGIGVDRSVGANLAHKIETNELLSEDEVAAIARDNTEATLADGFDLEGDDERELGHAAVKGQAVDMAVSLAGLHHREFAPTIHPSHVAQRFVLDIEGYDFQLAGEKDVREEHQGLTSIRDTKTAKASPRQGTADLSSQLTMYAMAELAEYGKLPDLLSLDYVVQTKTKLYTAQQVTKREVEDFQPLLNRVQAAIEAINRGLFYPADPATPGGWWCHPDRCGYWSNCRYVRNPTTVNIPQLVHIQGDPNVVIESDASV